jgi:hypothetical protein
VPDYGLTGTTGVDRWRTRSRPPVKEGREPRTPPGRPVSADGSTVRVHASHQIIVRLSSTQVGGGKASASLSGRLFLAVVASPALTPPCTPPSSGGSRNQNLWGQPAEAVGPNHICYSKIALDSSKPVGPGGPTGCTYVRHCHHYRMSACLSRLSL